MFSHIFVGVTDFDRAFAFYAPLMRTLALELRWHDPGRPWAGWHGPGGARPFFVICQPFDGLAHHPGNGQMVAFSAPDRDTVRRAHAVALQAGGLDEGAPGLRPHYHPHYYGAYFRDPDRNKLCVACHGEEEPAGPPHGPPR